MDNFKRASQLKLRFNTDKGLLSTEQLWDLSQVSLTNLIKSIKKVLKDSDGDDDLSFLTTEPKTVDVENQLRFDIAKDIYLTKKAELEEKRTEKEKKEHNQRILELIQKKKESKLESMSEEELTALLK
jgi:hypothetical protein